MIKVLKEKILNLKNKLLKFDKENGVLTKVKVFALCVIFVKTYIYLFGKENNIISIVLLIGLMVFCQCDLGFNVKQATASLFFMYMLITFASKISLINPYLGIFINLFSILSILILGAYIPEMENHTNILMSYIFCQGYNVAGETFKLRTISLVIGSIAIALIYYYSHKKNKYNKRIKDVLLELKGDVERIHWYIRITVSLTSVMFIGDVINMPRTMWISLTILSLTKFKKNDTKYRAVNRILGAVAGIIAFIVIYTSISNDGIKDIIMMTVGFLAMFPKSYPIKTAFNAFNALVASLLFFSENMAIALRIITNIFGIVFAVIFNIVMFKVLEFHQSKKEISTIKV